MEDSDGPGATVVRSDDTAPAGSDTGPAASGEHLRQLEVAGPTTLPTAPDGQYDLGDEHARGGLGRIVRGRDRRLDRTVAIKQLIRGTPVNRARFAREARITARLQHPGVVPIYEAGVWPSGQQFYAMRLVEGRALSAAIDDTRTLGDRLGLLSRVLVVCETMAYAHSRGVIHRDLKPSNVLVGEYGETVVIDWGIAKEIGESDLEADAPAVVASVDLTVAGQVIGTPWYMAPEQARGEPTDARSDVYALGAILYHVLAGVPPHADATKVVDTVAAGAPPPPLASRAPGVAPDLVAIVDKALAAAPQARYASAGELAADLKRYLNGQLVSVHRYGIAALVGRWVARHRAAVAIGALAVLALGVGGVISVRNIVSARDAARSSAAQLSAERDALILTQAESALDRDPTASLAWLKQYPLDGAEWSRVRTIAADAVSRGVAKHVLNQGEAAHDAAMSRDGRVVATAGANHVRVWNGVTGELVATHRLANPRTVALGPDGSTLVSNSARDPVIYFWPDLEQAARPLTGHTGDIEYLAIMESRFIVSASADGTARIWAPSGSSLRTIPALGPAEATVAVANGGVEILATLSPTRDVVVTAIATGESRALGRLEGKPLALTVSPDASLAATASSEGIWIWPLDGEPGRRLGASHGSQGLWFADRDTLIEATSDGAAHLWSVTTGASSLLAPPGDLTALATTQGGRIALAYGDGSLRLWKPAANQLAPVPFPLFGHRERINALLFSDDGRELLSSSYDYGVRIWRVDTDAQRMRRADRTDLFQLAYAFDGSVIATARSGVVYRFGDGAVPPTVIGRHGRESYGLAISDDGYVAVTAGWDGTVMAWDLARGTSRQVRGQGPIITDVALSPHSTHVAIATDDGASLGPIGGDLAPLPTKGVSEFVAFSHDGSTLAATSSGDLVFWDVATHREVRRFHGVNRAVFFADGLALATADDAGTVRVWDIASGKSQIVAEHNGQVRALAVSADDRWVASGGRDRMIRLWNMGLRASRALGHHDGEVRDLAFTPDGRTLASASYDGTARIWDLTNGSNVPIRGAGYFQRVAIRQDGRELAASNADGTLYTVPLPLPGAPPADPRQLLQRIESMTTAGAKPADQRQW